jgi:type IV pilus assembly protein PilM
MPRKHKDITHLGRVGLDIGSHAIKGVEVVQRDQELVVRSAGSLALPQAREPGAALDNNTIAAGVKSLWVSAHFESRNVVLALPADRVHVKWLNLEASSRDELDLTARAAAVRGAPFPPENAVVDYRVLASRGTVSQSIYFVMLVAASSMDIDRLLSIAEAAGLCPVAVDINAAAAIRMLDIQRRGAGHLWRGQPLANITVGARSTTIAVLRAGELEFSRTVPVGGADFTQSIAEVLGVTSAEAETIKKSPGARLVQGGGLIVPSVEGGEVKVPCENVVARLAREIQRSLRFFRSQFAEGSYLGMIGDTTMSGGGALLKGLDTCLQEQGVEVGAVINPFAGLSVDAEGSGVQHVGDSAAQYATAVGLAIADYWTASESDSAASKHAA